MRLYTVGVFLNGLLFLWSGGLKSPFTADMRISHGVVAVILACMGLVTVSPCSYSYIAVTQ